MNARTYLDHAATTPTDPQVVEAMLPFFTEGFGNPSSLNEEGRTAKAAVEEARAKVAALLEADPEEIVFTAGGTESDNHALCGVARHGVTPVGSGEAGAAEVSPPGMGAPPSRRSPSRASFMSGAYFSASW